MYVAVTPALSNMAELRHATITTHFSSGCTHLARSSDLIVEAENVLFSAHSVILARQSSVLDNVLSDTHAQRNATGNIRIPMQLRQRSC